MSQDALIEARIVDRDQAHRNDARRILQRVESALQGHHSAGIRWPFELIQNAHDFGARDGDDLVEIKFTYRNNDLIVSHNGRIFSIPELKALLSGGSSKEFDGDDTTGRFGTGFLVTHAISTRVDVDGILQTKDGQLEVFSIEISRPADEAEILRNIKHTDNAFVSAQPISDATGRPTVSFTYYNASPAIVEKGLDRLEQTIPYLFSTCHKLGVIEVSRPRGTTAFRRSPSHHKSLESIDGFSTSRVIVLASGGDGMAIQRFEVINIFTDVKITSEGNYEDNRITTGLLVILGRNDKCEESVILPESGFPKIFVQFPINETGSLPLNTVFNSRFKPKVERDGISMKGHDRKLIRSALSTFPSMVKYAVHSGWGNAHGLAQIDIPTQPLGGENTAEEELAWWKQVIAEAAEETASKPIISTEAGHLPALSEDDEIASFLVPATDVTEQQTIDYELLYGLALRITNIHLPSRTTAPDWETIARQWSDIGLSINRLGLKELTEWVKESCHSIEDLPISGDPFEWLADLFLLVSELPEHITPIPLLNGLVPDQHSQLRRAEELRLDGGISEQVKDIADSVAIDLRSELLHDRFTATLNLPRYEKAKTLAEKHLGKPFSQLEAVEAILVELDARLPDNESFAQSTNQPALHTSARLISFLAREDYDTSHMRRCPLLNAEDSIVRLSNNLQILAPVSHWPESARLYKDLYTENRLLSDRYVDDTEFKTALEPLINENLVIPRPLFKSQRASPIDGPLLEEIAPDCPVDRFNYRTHEFGQIAFLASELVPRCGNDKKLAELLLDFVINVAAKEDEDWHETWLTTPLPVDGEARPSFHTHNSTWPFELKVRSWLPVFDEEGKVVGQIPANEANLRPFLDSSWLRNNPWGIGLLHRVFGFRQLTLMLENMESDVESNLVQLLQDPELVKSTAANLDIVRATIANPEVAKILSEAGAEEIYSIRQELEKKRRQKEVRERNNEFGHAVQETVKKAVEALGLSLKLVDNGYDYEVFPDGASFTFEVGSYFLEVKATTTRDVRLTPAQAQFASENSERFVLCVVDLYGQTIREVWRPSDISSYARIITNIGGNFEEICERVTEFSDTGNLVHLRNEQMLRYGVSVNLWDKGVSIDQWVRSLSNRN